MARSESRPFTLAFPMAHRIKPASLVVIFVLTYLPLIRRADFRGDDYLIAWNAMIPGVNPFTGTTLVYSGVTKAWFLRPLFRILTKVSFVEFGFHYAAWLAGPVVLVALAAWLGARVVNALTESSEGGIWFMALFLGAFHLHLGSLLWVGEGLMNAPQIFLLSASLYCWVVLESDWGVGLALALYGLSLGLKESSVFFPLFLWALPHSRRRIAWFFALGGMYLVLRLGLVPWNPSYSPLLTWSSLSNAGKLVLGMLLTPLLVWPHPRDYARYIPFFTLTAAPCFGHDFFSPGWLLLPGFFLLLTAVVLARPESLPRTTLLATLISAVVAISLLFQLHWWQWQSAEARIRDLVRSAPDSIEQLVIEQCDPRPLPGPARVLGDEDSLSALWNLVHHRPIAVEFEPCSAVPRRPRGTLRLRWSFAELETKNF